MATAEVTVGDRSVHHDPQVVPAGAHVLRHHGKHRCSQGGCGPDGRCVGTCVVRPERFGYYATQWRAWPGDQGVQQTSLEEMTPVSPPASAIPSVDQEALLPGSLEADEDERPGAADAFGFGESVPPPQAPPQPAAPGEALPGLQPQIPQQPRQPSLFDEATPSTDPTAPSEPAAPSEERPTMPEATRPEPEKPAEKTDDQLDNLFDEFGSRLRLRERLAVAHHRLASVRATERSRGSTEDAAAARDDVSDPPQRLPEAVPVSRSLGEEHPPQAVVVPAGETQPRDEWRRPRTAVVSEEVTDREPPAVQPAGGTGALSRRNPLR